jgi:hypothetical protein
VAAPDGTYYSSFEATDPPTTPTGYGALVNVTGKKYAPGSLMMYVDIANIRASGSKSASAELPAEVADGSTGTKWLDDRNQPWWVTYPLTSPQTVAQYVIGTANDAKDRDPMNWVFAGSNDVDCIANPTAANWTTVDSRTGVDLGERYVLNTFVVPAEQQASYQCYRLHITSR